MRAYRAPAWLPGGHLQTIYPSLVLKQRPPPYRRERWETPDGDFIDLDHVQEGDTGAPRVVLFHGLEGSSDSHYARALMRMIVRHRWHGVVVHFRGCGGEANRLPRAYHSGDADEIDWILRRMRERDGARALFATGVSLGGNALLKWLAREGECAGRVIDAAAAISAPVALGVAGDRLCHGFNRLYGWHFLHTLKKKSFAKLAMFPGLFDAAAVRNAGTLRAFDDVVTAPLHGFRDADDYWTRAASRGDLVRIGVPTLIVHARNDPFLPGSWLPRPDELPSVVTLEMTDGGGHCGFVSGPFPGNLDWLPARLLEFFSASSTGSSPIGN